VLGFEFTGAPTRYYPIELPENRRLNDRYQSFVREALGPDRAFFAGRLANYVYVDMDDCMRQALDTADQVLASL
jgi:UDP-galactopyranose mutase